MTRLTLFPSKRFLPKTGAITLALLLAGVTIGPSFFIHYCSAANAKVVRLADPIKKYCPDNNAAKGQLAQEGRGDHKSNGPTTPAIKRDTCCKNTQIKTHVRDGFTATDSVKVQKPLQEQSYEPVHNNFEIDALQKLFDLIADFFEDFVPSSNAGRTILRLMSVLRV